MLTKLTYFKKLTVFFPKKLMTKGTLLMFLQISLMPVLTEESWTLICASLVSLSWCIVLVEVYEENTDKQFEKTGLF